jgi:hypothetical protein
VCSSDLPEEQLAAGLSRDYRVEAYTLPPGDISVPGAMSVKMESHSSGERYVFSDITPLDLEVENKLDVEVQLRAHKRISDELEYEYIEYIKADGSTATALTIPPGQTGKGAKIYTIDPNFTVALYSPAITWKFEDNIMKVLIE